VPSPRKAPAAGPSKSPITCGLAIASLICSCAGLLFGYLGTIPGIICGFKALGRIRRNPGLGGRGLAIAGLVTGGLLSLLWIPLSFIVITGVVSGFKAAARVHEANANAARVREMMVEYDGSNLDATPDGSGWTLDLDAVAMPDQSLNGRVHGVMFQPDSIRLSDTDLSFTASAAKTELHVNFDGVRADQFSKQTLVVRREDSGDLELKDGTRFKKPDIRLGWFEAGMKYREGLPKIYAMRLEFGEIKNGLVPVRIYLCLLDDMKSFIRGRFVARVEENPMAPAGFAPPDTTPDAAGWTFDLENAVIPDTPVAGRMYGRPFKAQVVEMQGMFLTFRQGGFANQQEFQLVLNRVNPAEPGGGMDFNNPARWNGQTITVSSRDGFGRRPLLSVHSTLPQDFTAEMGVPDDYAMRLEFGEYKDGRLPGRIYLCALTGQKSFIRGTFEARVTTMGVMTGPARPRQPGNPPRNRQQAP
jgi:hypothetical protein